MRETGCVGVEMDKQLLHRVGSSRSDSLQKTLPFEGEEDTRDFVRYAVGLE